MEETLLFLVDSVLFASLKEKCCDDKTDIIFKYKGILPVALYYSRESRKMPNAKMPTAEKYRLVTHYTVQSYRMELASNKVNLKWFVNWKNLKIQFKLKQYQTCRMHV